ncbi:hypothetical protein NLJ89_g5977 [Agrocybe chaxingu]|uniref:Rhamnogalacturonase A/B/Epimerase-like pectate lyase domain-containing protein n=1 Tax=Agrocybe chaxingu TaxID=84603 RepID=A0A9W8MT51_9AGAR|nr:hypothetical protein NLJ89_g5977 [Agrocybe chaxingu]
MHFWTFLPLLLSVVVVQVCCLGSACRTPLGAGKAEPSDPYWMETIKHQGISAFNENPSEYQVFRNVKDFGAKGNGVADDTVAIKSVMAIEIVSSVVMLSSKQCNRDWKPVWWRITPAVVYFPQGTYLVSSPIIAYYYTQLIGDPKNPPTLLATPNFDGIAVIGKFGIWVGNQQFTVRNITINNAQTAVLQVWNWGWVFQDVTINNCQVGFDMSTGGVAQGTQTAGAIAIIDASITDTPVFVRTSQPSNGRLDGSIVINNAKLVNVPIAVGVSGGPTVLAGGTIKIGSWGQGNAYKGTNGTGVFTQGPIAPAHQSPSLLDHSGRIFGRTHPQYANYAPSQFVSVRDYGAKGDGITDDTAAIKAILGRFAGCKIIFFDAGTYIVTSTITIPAGTHVVGEAWEHGSGLLIMTWMETAQLKCKFTPGGVYCRNRRVLSGWWGQVSPSTMLSQSRLTLGLGSEHHVLYQYNLVNAKNHYLALIQTESPYFQPVPAPPTPFIPSFAFHDPTFPDGLDSSWALLVTRSSNILVFGAGLYSFFQVGLLTREWCLLIWGSNQNFEQTCLDTASCQSQVVNIDSFSTVSIYSLSTVATTFQLSVNQVGVINQSGNVNGFASTVTIWSRH